MTATGVATRAGLTNLVARHTPPVHALQSGIALAAAIVVSPASVVAGFGTGLQQPSDTACRSNGAACCDKNSQKKVRNTVSFHMPIHRSSPRTREIHQSVANPVLFYVRGVTEASVRSMTTESNENVAPAEDFFHIAEVEGEF